MPQRRGSKLRAVFLAGLTSLLVYLPLPAHAAECTTTATGPSQSGQTLSSSGSFTCLANHDQLLITIYMQIGPTAIGPWSPFDADQGTRNNASSINIALATACMPGDFYYNTRVTALAIDGGVFKELGDISTTGRLRSC